MNMKKTYEKPALICEDLLPEEMLCGCAVRNPQFNEIQQCGYTPPNLQGIMDVRLFGDVWLDCNMKDTDSNYCYHVGEVNIFSS
ncbi:MAG: hypothetical protein IKT58_00435 [Oscillospiraceae bacterium]|nr:hypothetical protein [Oscillospiraceae bacterium]